MKPLLTIGCLLLSARVIFAQGVVVTFTFDEVYLPFLGGSIMPPSSYDFHWNNFYVANFGDDFRASGYRAGVVSGKNIMFADTTGQVSRTGSFDLNSAYVTAAWFNGLQVRVEGYGGGVLLYDNTYTVNASGPTLINFGYVGVDTVTWTAFGGTDIPLSYIGYGHQFAIDDMVVTVPEPGVLPLGVMGVLGLFLLQSRRGAKPDCQ